MIDRKRYFNRTRAPRHYCPSEELIKSDTSVNAIDRNVASDTMAQPNMIQSVNDPDSHIFSNMAIGGGFSVRSRAIGADTREEGIAIRATKRKRGGLRRKVGEFSHRRNYQSRLL